MCVRNWTHTDPFSEDDSRVIMSDNTSIRKAVRKGCIKESPPRGTLNTPHLNFTKYYWNNNAFEYLSPEFGFLCQKINTDGHTWVFQQHNESKVTSKSHTHTLTRLKGMKIVSVILWGHVAGMVCVLFRHQHHYR